MGSSHTIKKRRKWRSTHQSASTNLLQLERKPRVFSTASVVCANIDAGEIERKVNPIRVADDGKTRGMWLSCKGVNTGRVSFKKPAGPSRALLPLCSTNRTIDPLVHPSAFNQQTRPWTSFRNTTDSHRRHRFFLMTRTSRMKTKYKKHPH